MIFSFTGYLGVNCVLNLVRHFGALTAVTGSSVNLLIRHSTKFSFSSYDLSKNDYNYSLIYGIYEAVYFSVRK